MSNKPAPSYEDLPDVLTVDDLQRWFRIGKNSAYNLANTPGFPHLKFGNRKVFPKAQVKEWAEREAAQNMLPRRLRAVK